MGLIDPVLAQIREPHLQFAYTYFYEGDLPDDLDPYLRGFAAAFLRRFPEMAHSPSMVPAAENWSCDTDDRLEQWEGEINNRFLDLYIDPEYEEGDPILTYRIDPGFRGLAALYAVKLCCTTAVGGGLVLTTLAEDHRLHNAGNLWRYLDQSCTGAEDREVARLFRRLMIDFSMPKQDFPGLIDPENASLLVPAETSRLLSGLPLLARFYDAIPTASEHDPRDSLRGGLKLVLGFLSSVRGEDDCLLSFY